MSAAEVTTQRTGTGVLYRLRGLIAAFVGVILMAAAITLGVRAFERNYAERIYPNVFIGDFDVGNMTQQEAAELVERHYDRTIAVFDFDGAKWFAPWCAIGVFA